MKYQSLITPVAAICFFATCLYPKPSRADDAQVRQDAIIVRAIERMQGYDYSQNEKVVAALQRHIERQKGTSDYVKLIKRFRPTGIEKDLEDMLFVGDNRTAQVEAIGMLAEMESGQKRIRQLLRDQDPQRSTRVAELLGLLGNGRATNMLSDIAKDQKQPYDVRRIAVSSLVKCRGGEQRLLTLAKEKDLAADLRLHAGGLMAKSNNEGLRRQAADLLPLPKQKDSRPLPPLIELAAMRGDISRGTDLFRTKATCANCHVVGEYGKEVGPNLTEIGSKLSREAMLTSILDPSAGISHNYENYVVLLTSGQVITGVKVSETDDEVVIRTAEAIDRTIKEDDIEQIKKSDKSIMPDDLHQTVDQQGLVDIIEYLMSLKKKA